MKKNILISQSGGPTPVINNSLRGVIDMCKNFDNAGTIYAGWHGIEGILKEELLNLSAQDSEEIGLLRTTPSAGSIGSCRYKLKNSNKEDFDRVIDVLSAHNIGYLFYIGGNDSMDTANKISMLAGERGIEIAATGVPKTIDNDVGDSDFKIIDHTPGYGSVAKYWTTVIQNANEENAGSSPSDPVLVIQAMGRKIGYIPASARLADPLREMPLLIYMTESNLTLPQISDDINDMLKKRGRAVVVAGEGLELGDIGELRDNFGHMQFSSSQTTAAQMLINYLNKNGLAARGSARCQIPGTDQRSCINLASSVDLDEAYILGCKAAEIAFSCGGGYMSTIIRNEKPYYSVAYDKVPLGIVANSERSFPGSWLTKEKNDVTDEFIKYAKPLIGDDWVTVPLIGGIMRFTRFREIFADKKLKEYVPQEYRKISEL